jgi:predicted nuclease of predicted toxin-antitoxin system
MRFLVDECTGSKTAEWLRRKNYEVFSVFDEARGMTDDEILTKACAENRILITNDKDFGEMIFREQREHHGIIFMRLDDERAVNKIAILSHLLENYADKLPEQFVVVTETKVRFAKKQ